MQLTRPYLNLFAGVLLFAAPMFSHAQVVDCEALKKVLKDKTVEADAAAVAQCKRRGMDAPKGWRQDEGKSAGIKVRGTGGGGGASTQAPEHPPGEQGAQASVDKAAINFSCNFPPKISLSGLKLSVSFGACTDFLKGLFSDKDGSYGTASGAAPVPGEVPGEGEGPGTGGTTGTGVDGAAGIVTDPSCPAATDSTGAFGAIVSLTKGSTPLVCGGAMPLTTYHLSVDKGADRLASTEHGAYYLFLYGRGGASYDPIGEPMKLPTFFGDWTRHEDEETHEVWYTCENIVDVPPPIAQMISYNSGQTQMILRLTSQVEDEADPGEHYLVLPMSSGIPQSPTYPVPECPSPTPYYKTTPPQHDIMVNSPGAACEGSADQCNFSGVSAGVTLSCDMVTLYTKGTTATTAGAVDCTGRSQMAVLNKPNLVFPPGTTPSLTPITGRTSAMVNTVDGSDLYLPTDTIVQFGASAGRFELPNGGTMLMKDGSQLLMNAPATLLNGSGNATLTNGGQLLSKDGHLVQEFPAGSTVSPTGPILPLSVKPGRNVTLPGGYMVPSQPSPFVRLPMELAK